MIPLYLPGNSWLHRSPASLKLAALLAISLVVSLLSPTLLVTGALMLGLCAAYLSAGVGLGPVAHQLWQLRWILVLMGTLLGIFVSPEVAIINVGRVVAIVLLAGLIARTTRTDDLLDVVRRALHPFRPVGAQPELVALTILLAITAIPVITDLHRRVNEAQHARGVRLRVKKFLPLMVLTLRHADDVADALAARGLA